ncbi:hypothetical protein ACQ4PT_009435 [Festuca glaucescens]
MAEATSEASGSGIKSDGDEALACALQHMELQGGELDDVVVGEHDLAEMKQRARWLAVARVHTTKKFSADALFQTLRYVWNLTMESELREVDDNLFTFKFSCLELYQTTAIVDQLARRIGHVKSVEMQHPRWFEGDYVRVKAIIDVNAPLICWTPLNISGTGRTLLLVKYEKIGYFCDVCGIMGHDLEECGDGVHKPEDIQFGKWMIAKRRTQTNTMPTYRDSFPARGGGRGRGGLGGTPFATQRKQSSGDADLDKKDDLRDTATSPMKTNAEETGDGNDSTELHDGDLNARKKLGFENMDEDLETEPKATEEEDTGPIVPPLPPAYVKSRDRSKLRRTDSGNSMASSAASFEEDRRA